MECPVWLVQSKRALESLPVLNTTTADQNKLYNKIFNRQCSMSSIFTKLFDNSTIQSCTDTYNRLNEVH